MRKMLLLLMVLLVALTCLCGSMQESEERGFAVPSVFVKERFYAESRV